MRLAGAYAAWVFQVVFCKYDGSKYVMDLVDEVMEEANDEMFED